MQTEQARIATCSLCGGGLMGMYMLFVWWWFDGYVYASCTCNTYTQSINCPVLYMPHSHSGPLVWCAGRSLTLGGYPTTVWTLWNCLNFSERDKDFSSLCLAHSPCEGEERQGGGGRAGGGWGWGEVHHNCHSSLCLLLQFPRAVKV